MGKGHIQRGASAAAGGGGRHRDHHGKDHHHHHQDQQQPHPHWRQSKNTVTVDSSSDEEDDAAEDEEDEDAEGDGGHSHKHDRHALYEKSVQSAANEVRYLEKFYLETNATVEGPTPKPLVLREDFCGTALLSHEWVTRDVERDAHGVDIDGEVIDWAIKHRDGSDRLRLYKADVLHVPEKLPLADILCAFNFSINFLHTRQHLLEYFKLCAENIEPTRGIFVLDYMDGWASWQPFKHARKVENFRCTFEQASYNPVTSKALCHLHFKFRDGSVFKKAFTYDWRRWHLPEIIDVMQEAGFTKPHVYAAERDHDSGSFQRQYERIQLGSFANSEDWTAYVIAHLPRKKASSSSTSL